MISLKDLCKYLVVAMLIALTGSMVGCGGGGEEVSPDSLVLTAGDVPGVQNVGAPFPEPCGPVSELTQSGGKAAVSGRFLLDRGEAVEAAAIFAGEGSARSAYRALGETKRLRCIGAAIRIYTGAPSVAIKRPQPLDLGDEAAVARFRVSDPSSGRAGYSDIVALRVGRCTASILVSAEDEKTTSRLTNSMGRIAAGLLSDPCG